ncbi:MAG: GDSL-type esterase/lipase family protein [Tepidisphaeraceae bacterium]
MTKFSRLIGAACAMALLGAVAPGAVALAAEPIRVMPLGDSITAGTTPGGYRGPMADRLTQQYGVPVITVGTQTDASLPPGHQAHEGHGGWRIDQLANNLLGVNAVDPSAHGGYWLNGGHGTGRDAVRPGFICVSAGINDINAMMQDAHHRPMSERGDEILKTLQDRQCRLIDTLTTERPDAVILVAGCIPYANGLLDEKATGATSAQRATWAKEDGVSAQQEMGVNHWVIRFDRWLREAYVPQLRAAGKKVVFVDQYANFILPDGTVRSWNNAEPQNTHGPAGYGDYGLHPNQFGYGLMGATWADAIHAQLAHSATR